MPVNCVGVTTNPALATTASVLVWSGRLLPLPLPSTPRCCCCRLPAQWRRDPRAERASPGVDLRTGAAVPQVSSSLCCCSSLSARGVPVFVFPNKQQSPPSAMSIYAIQLAALLTCFPEYLCSSIANYPSFDSDLLGWLLPSCVHSHFQTSMFTAAWRGGSPLVGSKRRAIPVPNSQAAATCCGAGEQPSRAALASASRWPTDRRPRSTRRLPQIRPNC